MAGLLAVVYLLSLVDIMFTYYGLYLGLIQEGNPLLAVAFNTNQTITVIGLILFISVTCAFLLWASDKVIWLFNILKIVLAVKIVVLTFHLGWVLDVYL